MPTLPKITRRRGFWGCVVSWRRGAGTGIRYPVYILDNPARVTWLEQGARGLTRRGVT